ncbi:UNKNOWN [Stylonychia lemnae]|uniref:Uncharacterized protein n=1 Tax=Stylonychia lemnae TaxID=5949 RepID=A0A077ZYR7_STYLE|nr:UNKNOWN [Stylonychia lemnae]|eukprot:CDW73678.1 UNKNOWN [Stylonychia lemnae]
MSTQQITERYHSNSETKNSAAYHKFFSEEYKQYQDAYNMNMMRNSTQLFQNERLKIREVSQGRHSFTRTQYNEDIKRIKNFQLSQRYTQDKTVKTSEFEKVVEKLKDELQEQDYQILQKYDVQNYKTNKEQSEQNQIEMMKDTSKILFDNLTKFMSQKGRRLDANVSSYINYILEKLKQNNEKLLTFSQTFLQRTEIRLTQLSEQIHEQSELVIQLKTEKTKQDILSKLYAQGYQQDDREEFIKQVDDFLKQDNVMEQLQKLAYSKERIKKFQFSGVTQSLDELYQLMQTFQDQAKYFSESQEQNINTHAFKYFHSDITTKLKSAQLETAKKVAQRFVKNIQYKDQEIQCNQEEYRQVIMVQIDDMSKKISDQEGTIRVQDSIINQLHDENNKAYNEKVSLLTQLRDLKEQLQSLESKVVQKNSENDYQNFQIFQNEKKFQNMYAEVVQMKQTIEKQTKQIQIQEKQIEYLRQNDHDFRFELKQSKADYQQKIRELRKAEKKLMKVGRLEEFLKEVEDSKQQSLSKSITQTAEISGRGSAGFDQRRQEIHSRLKQANHREVSINTDLVGNGFNEYIQMQKEKETQEFINNKIKQAIHQQMNKSKQSNQSINSIERSSNLMSKRQSDFNVQDSPNQEAQQDKKDIKSSRLQSEQPNHKRRATLRSQDIINLEQTQKPKIQQTKPKIEVSKNQQSRETPIKAQLIDRGQNKINSNSKFKEDSRAQTPISDASYNQGRNLIQKSVYGKREGTEMMSNEQLISANTLERIPEIRKGKINVTKLSVTMIDCDTQTDLYELFQFFIEFLQKIEQMISSGYLNEILLNSGVLDDDEQATFRLQMQKSTDRLLELQKYLGKISSLTNKGGDVFFRGICKIFQAQPQIFQQEQIDRFVKDKEITTASQASFIQGGNSNKNNMLVKVKYSVGGGYNKNKL